MSQAFELSIDGMHCKACVRRVERALTELAGVTVDEIELGRVRGTALGIEPGAIADAITAAGYPTAVITAG